MNAAQQIRGRLEHVYQVARTASLAMLVGLLGVQPGLAQGLTYVDADDDFFGGGTNANIAPLSAINQEDSLQDDLWGFRAFGADGTVWEAGWGTPDPTDPDKPIGDEDAPELTLTLRESDGLVSGQDYDIYVAYWSANVQDWTIRAGLTSGDHTLFNQTGPLTLTPTSTNEPTEIDAVAGVPADLALWTTPPPIMTEEDRTMFIGKVGTATATGGQIDLFIDDLPTSGFVESLEDASNFRTWLDGAAFVEAGTLVVFPPGDFNRDGDVGLGDLEIFRDNLHTDVSALPPEEASLLGDMDGDLAIDFRDFVAFRDAFNDANGAGSLQAALGVPEPSAAWLLLIAVALLVAARYRAQFRRQLCCTSRLAPRESLPHMTSFQSRGSVQIRPRSWTVPVATIAIFSLAGAARGDLVSGWGLETGFADGALTEGAPGSFEVLDVAGNAVPRALLPTGLDFSDVGDTVRLRGFATLENTLGDIQFRWGLFDTNGANTGTLSDGLWSGATVTGWQGYFASPGNNGGADVVAALDGGAYISVFGGNDTIAFFPASSDPPGGVEYEFSLTLRRRSATEIQADFTFFGGDEIRWGTAIDDGSMTTDAGGSTSLSTVNAVGFLTNPNTGDGMFRDVAVEIPEELGLRVNTTNGAVSIVNDTDASFDINYYEIQSDSGALDQSGWNSFADQDGNVLLADAWQEAGGSSENLLSEFLIDGMNSFAPSSSATLGNAFNVGATEDLVFWYGLPDGTVQSGFVEFVTGPEPLPGDFNGNGAVDLADYTVWRDNLGAAEGDLLAGNGDGGTVTTSDYQLWKDNFGASAAAGLAASHTAVPEPATLSTFSLAIVGLASRWRRRRTFAYAVV